jgi:hypothetical protein
MLQPNKTQIVFYFWLIQLDMFQSLSRASYLTVNYVYYTLIWKAEGQFQYTTSMLETPTDVKNQVLDNVVHC